MKKKLGLLLCSAALLFAAAPLQAQANEYVLDQAQLEQEMLEQEMLEQKQFEQACLEHEQLKKEKEKNLTLEFYEAGEENLSLRPEGELNPEAITIGGLYYDAEAQKLILAADYKFPEGVNNASYSLFQDDFNMNFANTSSSNGYETVLWYAQGVESMPTEAYEFTVGFLQDGQWVAYKTVELEPVEWTFNGSYDKTSMHENDTGVYLTLYLPAEANDADFALFCGDKIVGTPRYKSNGTSSYIYHDFGLHNPVYYSMVNRVNRVSGSIQLASKLDADKEYVVKARWADEWVTFGTVEVKDGIYVTSAYREVFQEKKPVVSVSYQGVSIPNFTVELVDMEGAVLASATGAPDIYTGRNSGMWILNTDKAIEDLSETTIRVKDASGAVLYTNEFYYNAQVFDFYYDYYNGQMVLLTTGIPDGTEINVSINVDDKVYVGKGTVAGDKAVVAFTCDGVPCELPEGYYSFNCTYTLDWEHRDYLYGEIYSIEDNNTSDPDSYNGIFDGDEPMSGISEFEFAINVYKNTFDKYSGDIAIVLKDSNGDAVGAVEVLGEPQIGYWELGNNSSNLTEFYIIRAKWTGEVLEAGDITVELFRGAEQVSEFEASIEVWDSEKTYGYISFSAINDDMAIYYRSKGSIADMDLSLLKFNFTDFAGNVLDLPVTLYNSYNSYAWFTIDTSKLSKDCLGIKCTATYNGKPVYYLYNPDEIESAQASINTDSYIFSYLENNLHPFYDATYGIYAEGDVTVEVRECGSTEVVATWKLTEGTRLFDEAMLAGLTYNDFTKPYMVTITSADGYSVYDERVYFHIDGQGIIGKDREAIESFVNRMYSVILEREPDAGSQTWIYGLMTDTMTGVRVADGFIMSNELLSKNLSNEEFVKVLYRAFFGREADAEGLATWTGLLNNGYKKAYIFAGFANSREFGNLCDAAGITQGRAAEYLADCRTDLSEKDYKVWCFVERMYQEVLNRTADEPGVRDWVGRLKAGTNTGVQVAEGFLMSEEFLYRDMTNEEYVKIMYRAFFGRDADLDGLKTWTDALANGWTKQRVFAGFANSNEFGNLCQQAGITQGTVPEQ